MLEPELAILLADIILIVHVLFAGFVVFGLVAIFLGYFLNWPWMRNKLFRFSHLIAIGKIVVQSWFGVICPLTIWEMELRSMGGGEVYAGSFVQYWLHALLFYSAPEWVFITVYTVFGILVVASWIVVRPK